MSKADYYELLGVTRTCTEAELKSAFRKAAMQHHPDRNPGDKDAEVKFKEINEAYQALSDKEKRAAYDRFGHAAFEQGGGGAGGFGGDGFASSMSDIFDDLFGGFGGGRTRGGGGNGRERGSDLRYNMEIMLEDAFKGKTATIKVPTSVACEPCAGSGAKPGSKPKTCSTCAGAGRVTRDRSLSVNIPAGVEDGTRIRLSGEGEAGMRGGPSGDLYIFLSIKPHLFFQRDGADLFCQVPISMVKASLGGEVSVRTLDGAESVVKIPEGTQSGRQFKLRGKGMPVLRSREVGDLHIQARVETPQSLTKRQRELLTEFEAESSNKTHPESAGFFAKMKDFFDNISGA